jgi:hypothetical protein
VSAQFAQPALRGRTPQSRSPELLLKALTQNVMLIRRQPTG